MGGEVGRGSTIEEGGITKTMRNTNGDNREHTHTYHTYAHTAALTHHTLQRHTTHYTDTLITEHTNTHSHSHTHTHKHTNTHKYRNALTHHSGINKVICVKTTPATGIWKPYHTAHDKRLHIPKAQALDMPMKQQLITTFYEQRVDLFHGQLTKRK